MMLWVIEDSEPQRPQLGGLGNSCLCMTAS